MTEESTTPDLIELVRRNTAAVSSWADGLAERITNHTNIDEGRAAAERLAESRG